MSRDILREMADDMCRVDELIQADIRLTALERYTLIGALCDKLKWLHDHGGTRADHVGLATRILEIARSLPYDGDAA